MKPLRLSAFAAALVLAACTASPTTSADPAGPSFDGGTMIGSGNNSDGSEGPGTIGSGNDAGEGVASDTTGRGINTLGGGN